MRQINQRSMARSAHAKLRTKAHNKSPKKAWPCVLNRLAHSLPATSSFRKSTLLLIRAAMLQSLVHRARANRALWDFFWAGTRRPRAGFWWTESLWREIVFMRSGSRPRGWTRLCNSGTVPFSQIFAMVHRKTAFNHFLKYLMPPTSGKYWKISPTDCKPCWAKGAVLCPVDRDSE